MARAGQLILPPPPRRLPSYVRPLSTCVPYDVGVFNGIYNIIFYKSLPVPVCLLVRVMLCARGM